MEIFKYFYFIFYEQNFFEYKIKIIVKTEKNLG